MLAAGPPSVTGAENFHFWAALSDSAAKYLLGPADSSRVLVTFPAESTNTLTATRTVPQIVWLAPLGTSGKTWESTRPFAMLVEIAGAAALPAEAGLVGGAVFVTGWAEAAEEAAGEG